MRGTPAAGAAAQISRTSPTLHTVRVADTAMAVDVPERNLLYELLQTKRLNHRRGAEISSSSKRGKGQPSHR